VEIPSPVAGRVLETRGNEGDIVPVGSVIVVIETEEPAGAATAPGGAGPGRPASGAAEPGQPAAGAATGAASLAGPAAGPAGPAAAAGAAGAGTVSDGSAPAGRRVLATPATRRLARELGVDIRQVPGTGPGGRVTAEDVRAYAAARAGAQAAATPEVATGRAAAVGARAAAPAAGAAATPAAATTGAPAAVPAAPPTGTPGAKPAAPAAGMPGARPATPGLAVEPGSERRIPLRGLRKRIAEKMVESKFTAPHVTHVEEVDVTELVELRRKALPLAEQRGIKLTYLPFLVKAVVAALQQNPIFNASLDPETQEIVLKGYYHIGIATATDDGLIVPVVKDADRKSIFQLAQEIAALTEAARQRRIALDDVRGSTFTITNVGALGGGVLSTPIINYPEVAILGVHKFRETPVVRDGQIVVRTMTYLALSFDHRVADGADAVRFVNRIKEYIEQPSLLFLEMA
ncbi:MAG TPA: dihydrolipoamide acetyltransferase family protein, partial [Thermaerobacter sp.]